MGIPFQPVAGMIESDIPAASGLKTVSDPYTGQEVCVVGQIRPDWAIVHVPEADEDGNARIYGTPFWDRIISRAARGVIISTERVVSRSRLAEQPELTAIPGLFVTAVIEAPGGALPCSSTPDYGVDMDGLAAYLRAATAPDTLHAYLEAQDRELRGRPPHRAA